MLMGNIFAGGGAVPIARGIMGGMSSNAASAITQDAETNGEISGLPLHDWFWETLHTHQVILQLVNLCIQ